MSRANSPWMAPLGTLSVITADARPEKSWGCEEWMRWHQELEKVYGRQIANDFWIKSFKSQSLWDSEYNWCKYNAEFARYFKSVGINVGHIISNAWNAGTGVLNNLFGVVKFVTKPGVLITIGIIAAAIWAGPKVKKTIDDVKA